MIRTKEFEVPPDLKKAWNNAVAPLAKAALEDFRSWPLYQHVGEPWHGAPKRFVRVASVSEALKGLKSSATKALDEAANPGLRAMYMNLSTVLNVRQQFFYEDWDRVQSIVWKETEKAFGALSKRLKLKTGSSDKGFWLYGPNMRFWQSTWERMHPTAVEEPFCEHFVAIFRSGHMAAGLQGKDWKTCQFLYY